MDVDWGDCYCAGGALVDCAGTCGGDAQMSEYWPDNDGDGLGAGIGYAISFDGIDDLITTPIDADRDAMPSTTWSGWIKPTTSTTWQVIFGMEDGGWDRMLVIEPNSTQLSMGRTTQRWMSGAYITLDVWQHVVAIYDDGAMRLYLNGIEYTRSEN